MASENGTNWIKIILGSMITVFLAATTITANSIYNVGKDRENADNKIESEIMMHEAKFAKMEECLVGIKEDLSEIKSILKRTSPYERENVNRKNLSLKDHPVPQTY